MNEPLAGAPLPDGYRANRTLVLLVLALALLYAVVWDLRGLGVPGLGAATAGLAGRLGMGWFAAFLGRLFGDPFCQGMLAALLVLGLYGAFQWWGVARDRRCLRGLWRASATECAGGLGAVASLLTSRPADLPRRLHRPETLELHFGYGRGHLLEPLRLGLWAFPVVGFIGTVVGVSQAVNVLPTAMKDDAALGAVLASLHLAFDTTFLGLVSSVVVMLLLYAIDSAWTGNEVMADELIRRCAQHPADLGGAPAPGAPPVGG